MTAFRSIVKIVRLGRPHFGLPLAIGCTAGWVAASGDGELGLGVFLASVGILALSQVAWTTNELTDHEDDQRFGERTEWRGIYVSGGTQELLPTDGCLRRRARIACGLYLVIGLACLAMTTPAALLTGIGLSLCGLAYSLKPIRLKKRGLAGVSVVALAMGSGPFLVGWTATGQAVPVEWIWILGPITLMCLAGECIAHQLDRDGDRAAAARTVAVRLGRDRCSALICVLLCASMLVLIGGAASISGEWGSAVLLICALGVVYVLALCARTTRMSLAKARILCSAVSAAIPGCILVA